VYSDGLVHDHVLREGVALIEELIAVVLFLTEVKALLELSAAEAALQKLPLLRVLDIDVLTQLGVQIGGSRRGFLSEHLVQLVLDLLIQALDQGLEVFLFLYEDLALPRPEGL
jgi:hypothetical protein